MIHELVVFNPKMGRSKYDPSMYQCTIDNEKWLNDYFVSFCREWQFCVCTDVDNVKLNFGGIEKIKKMAVFSFSAIPIPEFVPFVVFRFENKIVSIGLNGNVKKSIFNIKAHRQCHLLKYIKKYFIFTNNPKVKFNDKHIFKEHIDLFFFFNSDIRKISIGIHCTLYLYIVLIIYILFNV